MQTVSDLHVRSNLALPSPHELLSRLPRSDRHADFLIKSGLKPAIMIDASHGNCLKDYRLMPAVFEEILRQRAAGDTSIIRAMLESNLIAGAQKFPQPLDQLVYGQSITDACIDWETTVQLLTPLEHGRV